MEKKFFILNVVGKSAFFYWRHDRENVEYLDLRGTEKNKTQEKVRQEKYHIYQHRKIGQDIYMENKRSFTAA